MADEAQSTENAAAAKTARVIAENTPNGNLLQNYGAPVGAGAIAIALIEFLGKDGSQTGKILAYFGPKWIFFTVLTFVLWDLLKCLLKLAGRAVAHIGELAANTGRAADGVQAFAAKSDRTAEEQQRLTTFAVQTSQRSVELATENNQLLKQLIAKMGGGSA